VFVASPPAPALPATLCPPCACRAAPGAGGMTMRWPGRPLPPTDSALRIAADPCMPRECGLSGLPQRGSPLAGEPVGWAGAAAPPGLRVPVGRSIAGFQAAAVLHVPSRVAHVLGQSEVGSPVYPYLGVGVSEGARGWCRRFTRGRAGLRTRWHV